MQNAIKLENISNLITSPSSYQCRKTRLVHFVIHAMANTHRWNVCVRTGYPQREIFKTNEKKKISYRIIRIKRIFSRILLMYNLDQVTHKLT